MHVFLMYRYLSTTYDFSFCFSSRLHGDADQNVKTQTSPLNEHDRLQLPVSGSRRESFLYRSDSDCDNPPPPLSSRSSISSEGWVAFYLVSPCFSYLSRPLLDAVQSTLLMVVK